MQLQYESGFCHRLVITGVICGIAAGLMYPIRAFVPLPDFLVYALFMFFGPVYMVGILGLFPFLAKENLKVIWVIGTLFGVISGVVSMMFAVVQLENLIYIRSFIDQAASSELKESWQHILQGVFTVQNGLNYVSDFFLDSCILLFAIGMWRHPKFGPFFTITGVLAGGSHLVLKAFTFPYPPSEAGLIDAGPAVSVWFSLVVIQVIRNLSWTRPVGHSSGYLNGG